MVITDNYICEAKDDVFENNNVSCFTASLYCSPPDVLPLERISGECDTERTLETIGLETSLSKWACTLSRSASSVSAVCDSTECQRVIINVSGMHFETQLKTLNRLPETLLGDPEKRQKYWDERRQEFFFDRHRPTFQAVLYYYQSGGRLKRPIEVPADVFLDEILFYQLDPAVVDIFRPKEASWQEDKLEDHFGGWKRFVWDIFETPSSSRFALIMAVFSILMTFVSVICICVETLPDFKHNSCLNVSAMPSISILGDIIAERKLNDSLHMRIPDRVKNMTSSSKAEPPEAYHLIPNYTDTFFLMESSYIVYFLIEFILRLLSCPDKLKFVKNFLNLTDIVVIISFIVTVSITIATGRCVNSNDNVFVVLRTFRVMRIFKLGKHSRGMRILGQTMYSSFQALTMFLMFIMIGVVVYSSGIYYAELHLHGSSCFKSIPDTFWFCMVTITTVGYGEVYPMSIAGKLVGSLCVFSGVVAIALPVPIIATNFSKFYYAETRRGHRPVDMSPLNSSG